jgi:hypothetical protein
VIVAQPRGLLDHIEWAAAHSDFDEAIAVSQKFRAALPEGFLPSLVDRYITALLAEGLIDEAAKQCQLLLEPRADVWEARIGQFLAHNSVHARTAICSVAPVEAPRLSTACYDKMLLHLLEHDADQFLTCVRRWSGRFLDSESVWSGEGDAETAGPDVPAPASAPVRRSSVDHGAIQAALDPLAASPLFDVKAAITALMVRAIASPPPPCQSLGCHRCHCVRRCTRCGPVPWLLRHWCRGVHRCHLCTCAGIHWRQRAAG